MPPLKNFSKFFFFVQKIAIFVTFIGDYQITQLDFQSILEKENTVKVGKTLVFPHFPHSNFKPSFSLLFSACDAFPQSCNQCLSINERIRFGHHKILCKI